ncbi:hypothetical protein Bache_2335 [Bacteroides helcogenes P 36-108]|uniref:Uncharacterized protein n=1 Tax=Bacteroides helcogenes (strain ATCC 35417 / DSM 20613 / JCM 6297 / CCUG 15421 / P 36-108) TaxID=693979 RepID=E6STQ6_BACT6|nr:hypothetical protein Bache_2335 [Bacteroides helcogenes P 36-108]
MRFLLLLKVKFILLCSITVNENKKNTCIYYINNQYYIQNVVISNIFR